MNILIKAPASILEIILFIPVLKKIKAHYESVFVVVLAGQQARELLSLTDCYDEIYPYQSGAQVFKSILFIKKSLSKYSFDYFISFDNRVDLSLYSILKRIPIRISDATGISNFFIFNKRIDSNRDFGIKHEAYSNLDLTKELGFPFVAAELLRVEFKVKNAVPADDKLIFIHLDAGGNKPYWSSRNFARLLLKIYIHNPEYHFIVYGTQEDQSYRASFHDQLLKEKYTEVTKKITYLNSSKSTLKSLIPIIDSAEVVIGHNAGISHIKSALNGKAIILFNPIRQFSAMRLSPFKSNPSKVKIVLPQVVCGETFSCSGSTCPYYDCMSKLVVNEVFKNFELLEKE
jgi:heptosyltransferase III